MATIGLDGLYYSKITSGENEDEIYSAPKVLAKPTQVDISPELLNAKFWAGDGIDSAIDEFNSAGISLGINDLLPGVAVDLLGETIDANGVLVSSAEDVAPYVAVAFRARKPNGKYRYFWFYRVKFSIPSTNLQTKGESVNFSYPTITGTVMRRNKKNAFGKRPWKTEVTEGETGVTSETIDGWYESVYEPVAPKP